MDRQRRGGSRIQVAREYLAVESSNKCPTSCQLATTPPLCLDPSPHLTRVANHVLRASTPTVPMSLKRKAAVLELEEEESEKVRRAKIIKHGIPPGNDNRIPTPS